MPQSIQTALTNTIEWLQTTGTQLSQLYAGKTIVAQVPADKSVQSECLPHRRHRSASSSHDSEGPGVRMFSTRAVLPQYYFPESPL